MSAILGASSHTGHNQATVREVDALVVLPIAKALDIEETNMLGSEGKRPPVPSSAMENDGLQGVEDERIH